MQYQGNKGRRKRDVYQQRQLTQMQKQDSNITDQTTTQQKTYGRVTLAVEPRGRAIDYPPQVSPALDHLFSLLLNPLRGAKYRTTRARHP